MIHLALQFCVDGKYFAQAESASETSNLASFFAESKGLVAANAFRTKKAATEAATAWNAMAKQNGNYYYDSLNW